MNNIVKNPKYKDCIKLTNDKKIVFNEKKSKYVAKNNKNNYIYCLNIDCSGDVKGIIDKGVRCDKGLWIDTEKKLFLIELKGCDLVHAYDQIIETYNWFYKNVEDKKDVVLYVRIVITKSKIVPEINFKRQKLIKCCKWGNIKDNIIVKEKVFEENI